MFAEHSTAVVSTALSEMSLTGVTDVIAQGQVRDVPQGWVGFAAVGAGVIMGAVALLKRGRQVSLARRRRHTGPSNEWGNHGSGAPRDLANGPLR